MCSAERVIEIASYVLIAAFGAASGLDQGRKVSWARCSGRGSAAGRTPARRRRHDHHGHDHHDHHHHAHAHAHAADFGMRHDQDDHVHDETAVTSMAPNPHNWPAPVAGGADSMPCSPLASGHAGRHLVLVFALAQGLFGPVSPRLSSWPWEPRSPLRRLR